MTKSELNGLVDKVRTRHNVRVVICLAVMLVVFVGGLSLTPDASPDPAQAAKRRAFIFGIVAAYVGIATVGGVIIFRLAKTDCYRFGVICPKCRQHLYSRRPCFSFPPFTGQFLTSNKL